MYSPNGMCVVRHFTVAGVDPYSTVEWSLRTAEIKDYKTGRIVFRQEGVEFPVQWSDQAVQIVASKYFYGDVELVGVPVQQGGRETSVRQLISRVVDTFTDWGRDGGYFASEDDAQAFNDELTYMSLHQMGAFNSPVWFNVGLFQKYGLKGPENGWWYDVAKGEAVPSGDAFRYPQGSACFVQSVKDDMNSIMDLAKSEAMLFKFGSGTGSCLSTLRSTREKLRGGGKPSGPVSFLKVYDTVAGIIKSGGVSRRAARMNTLRDWHPDVLEFASCKAKEDKKARALIAAGYEADFNGEAYGTVAFQNTNLSIRLSDLFMEAVESDGSWTTKAVTDGRDVETWPANRLMDEITDGTWICGDPGTQYEDTIQRWHTVPNDGKCNTSNPCAEFLHLDETACNLASINLLKFRNEDGTFDVDGYRQACRIYITAQEIIVSNASYPTKGIAEKTNQFRPLGLGYANIGALLMANGLAYDSEEGRQLAGAITAIMLGEAYLTSSQHAGNIGPFEGFANNREPMMKVMALHASYVNRDYDGVPYIKDMWIEADRLIGLAIESGHEHGYRNAQVNLLAPTGCVTPGTLVLTDKGLRRIGTLGDREGQQWQDVDFKVQTHEGPKQATKFFVNGMAHTISMETRNGYRFNATPKHQIKVVVDGEWQWRRMDQLLPGDIVPMRLGGMTGDPIQVELPPLGKLHFNSAPFSTPKFMTEDLAELLGAFMANGSSHEKGLRISVFKDDVVLTDRTVELFNEVFGLKATVEKDSDSDEVMTVVCHSVPMRRWWTSCGFDKVPPHEGHTGKGYKAHIPDKVLETNNRDVYISFLGGYIDHDGTVSGGVPEFMSASRDLVHDLQVLALVLGYPTKCRSTKSEYSGKPMWRAHLNNITYNKRWLEEIGFTESRKENACNLEVKMNGKNDLIPMTLEYFELICPIGNPLRGPGRQQVIRTGGVTRTMAETIRDTCITECGSIDYEFSHMLEYYYDTVKTTELSDTFQETLDLSVPDNVAYIAGGFVSHNTIAFMMSCDTTGIEPELALVKYKNLAGGGSIKIVNQTVPMALRTLGYSNADIISILDYIDKNDTIEGSILEDEHLPVFDCAFKAANGVRSISFTGHVDMMAAVQPFLSGAISKSICLPEDCAREDIKAAYIYGWKKGLKAIAIYRDNSKGSQPLNVKQDSDPVVSELDCLHAEIARLTKGREKLPPTRQSLTHKFVIQQHEGYITAGMRDDGSLAEVFITMSKEGSTLAGLMDSLGIAISLGLQHGVPLETLVEKFSFASFEPNGSTANKKQIPFTTSIVDYLVRWLDFEFPGGRRLIPQVDVEKLKITTVPKEQVAKDLGVPVSVLDVKKPKSSLASKICLKCGGVTVPVNGRCYTCTQCGDTSGGCG